MKKQKNAKNAALSIHLASCIHKTEFILKKELINESKKSL